MRDILARRNLATLANFACSSVLLGFDYDGTLAPIVSHPGRARMRAATRRLLRRVAERYPCVVISGRRHLDLVRRLGRLPLWHILGNHGVEPWGESDDVARQVGEWVRHLRARLVGHPGLVVEDKKYSATVHYRRARNTISARRAIRKAVAELPNVRALGGKKAVNLIPRGAADKGSALQRARRVCACETAIYVGDDDTDEDAFASAPGNQLLAIRVGAAHRSRAHFCVREQTDIDALLQTLLELRTQSGTAARSRRQRS